MTNGTETHFYVDWSTVMTNCSETARGARERWFSEEQSLEFSIAPDGKVPDIAEAIRSCEYQTIALEMADIKELVGCSED